MKREAKKKNKFLGSLSQKQRIYVIIATIVAIIAILLIIFFTLINKGTRIINPTKKEEINEKFNFLLKEESTELENFDMYDAQNVFLESTLKMYKENDCTLDKALVVINPFVISPQSALVLFRTDKKEKVTVTLKGKHNDDITRTYEASKDHILPIYGLYEGYKNELQIETESGKKKTLILEVEYYPYNTTINGVVEENNLGNNTNGDFYFTSSSLGSPTAAYDTSGEVRWYLTMGYSKGMTMLQNGNILLSNDSLGPDNTSTSGIVEVDMMGYVVREYQLEGGYHHDGYEMKNGNLLILTSDTKNGTFADYIIELDRKTGQPVKDWSLTKIVKEIDPSITEFYPTWGWINSITYDESSNSLILSVRNENSVVSIDYSTGKLNWILGESKYWSDAFDKYLIKGVGENFIYPAGQHSVNITKDGYLSIFNNGYNAFNEEEQTCASLKNNASYAMLYKLDLNKMTAEVVWKYGGQEYFSYALSSFTYTKDNHKIFNSGWHFTDKVDYNNPKCTQFSNEYYDTRIIEFDENNNIVFKMRIDESKFEVIKANIYNLGDSSIKPNGDKLVKNYTAKKATVTSTVTSDYKKLSEKEALAYKNSESTFSALYANNGKVGINAVVGEEIEINVIFISLKGEAYKFNLKQSGSEEFKEANIYSLPKGRYYIYAEVGEHTYNSLQHVIVD